MPSRSNLFAILTVALGVAAAGAQEPLHRDHDNGVITGTVTAQGILGRETEGLQYPGLGFGEKGQQSVLWIGSFWAGTGLDYLLNRDYFFDPAQEWQSVGGVAITYGDEAPQEFESCASDSGHVAPRGLHLRLRSRVWFTQAAGRFILLDYTLENRGVAPIADLYAGLFLDMDVGGGAADSTIVEGSNRLIYTYDKGLDPPFGTAGLALLGDETPSNLSALRNEDYVHAQNYVLDESKWQLLTGTLQFDAVDGDGSMVAAIGPFSLGPGESHELAFAMIHAHGEQAFREAALAAQQRWRAIRIQRGELPAARPISFSELKSRF